MKPTPEQIAAVKAFVRNCDTVEHRDILRDYMALGRMTPGVASQHILLAALEAAEVDGARLDWLEEAHKVQGINFAKYRSNDSTYIEHLMHSDDCEDIARGGNVREAIDAARKEAQP